VKVATALFDCDEQAFFFKVFFSEKKDIVSLIVFVQNVPSNKSYHNIKSLILFMIRNYNCSVCVEVLKSKFQV